MTGLGVAETRRRLRGEILELVCEGHDQQHSRFTDAILWGVLQRLKYDCSQNDVITHLQDLQGRGYLKFEQEKQGRTSKVRISLIEITPRGRDLVEGNIPEDPGVLILR
ncbi:MAG TPA: hypothetical protein VFB79_21600 [Candidatus Angelobacter sp.]|nr:hypothetical protein [Candidatus Angelobacter sp.]